MASLGKLQPCSSTIVAELRTGQALEPLQGYSFPSDAIPERARAGYLLDGQQAIVDLDSERKTLLYCSPQSGQIQQQHERVEPCHLSYLRAMGIGASLTVPVIYQQQLWGLLLVHDSQRHRWHQNELQAVQLHVEELLVALAHSERVQRRQRELQLLQECEALLADSDGVQLPGDALLEACLRAADADGARLQLDGQALEQEGQLYVAGVQPLALSGASPPIA